MKRKKYLSIEKIEWRSVYQLKLGPVSLLPNWCEKNGLMLNTELKIPYNTRKISIESEGKVLK